MNEADAILVLGIILMVIGAVWLSKKTAGAAVGRMKRIRKIQVEETLRDFVSVDRDVGLKLLWEFLTL